MESFLESLLGVLGIILTVHWPLQDPVTARRGTLGLHRPLARCSCHAVPDTARHGALGMEVATVGHTRALFPISCYAKIGKKHAACMQGLL